MSSGSSLISSEFQVLGLFLCVFHGHRLVKQCLYGVSLVFRAKYKFLGTKTKDLIFLAITVAEF